LIVRTLGTLGANGVKDDSRREFEVGTAEAMQEKYGWFAENRRKITLNPNNVPDELRHLIPLAEKFGVGCDITRHDLGDKTSKKEKQELSESLKYSHGQIVKWLNRLQGDNSLAEEPMAFMRLCVFESEECGGPGLIGKCTDEEADEWHKTYLLRRYGTAK
jgi:hypothetical protein